jgi:hypothetical protein
MSLSTMLPARVGHLLQLIGPAGAEADHGARLRHGHGEAGTDTRRAARDEHLLAFEHGLAFRQGRRHVASFASEVRPRVEDGPPRHDG